MKKHPQIKRILAILGVITVVMSSLVLPINAAATEQAETETFWDKYPFFNIMPLTWTGIEGEHNGTTVTVDENGAIHISGKINAPGENPMKPGELMTNYYDIVLYNGKGIELPQTVTIASNDTSKRSYLYLYLEGSNRINVPEGETVTFNTNGKKLTKLILRLRYDPNDKNPNDCIVQPMLNAGAIAYPYQPYAVKDQLVGEGYDKGYQNGYNDGTDNALGVNQCDRNYNPIYTSEKYKTEYNFALTKEVISEYSDEEKHLYAMGYADTVAGGGTFHYTCCANKSWLYLMGDEHYWLDQGLWEGEHKALGTYECTWFTDTQNHPFYNDVYQNAYEYFKAKHPELLERDLELMAQGAADWEFKEEIGFHYTCCANKNSYYLAGYEADIHLTAKSEGYATGYEEGYTDGNKIGHKAGKEEGMEIAKLGNWESLMTSVVQAPVNAFQGLFNFQVLGMDMRTAFGSILAICVLLIIIKKVVL